MKFYRIYESTDVKEIGSYPQSTEARILGNVWNSQYLSNYFLQQTNGEALVPNPIIKKRAKNTDLLSCSTMGFEFNLIVSAKLAEIIKVGNFYGLEFYEITATKEDRNVELPYVLIHPYAVNDAAIDFSKSIVEIKRFGSINERINVNNLGELVAIGKNLPIGSNILITNLVLNQTQYDFFVLRGVDNGGVGWFVSEKLKEAIERDACSGIVFKEINEQYP